MAVNSCWVIRLFYLLFTCCTSSLLSFHFFPESAGSMSAGRFQLEPFSPGYQNKKRRTRENKCWYIHKKRKEPFPAPAGYYSGPNSVAAQSPHNMTSSNSTYMFSPPRCLTQVCVNALYESTVSAVIGALILKVKPHSGCSGRVVRALLTVHQSKFNNS